MLVVTALTFIVVMPIVLAMETLRRPPKGIAKKLGLLLVAATGALVLAGCDSTTTSKVSQAIGQSVNRASEIADRAKEFAASAPTAPYEPIGNPSELAAAAADAGVQLSGTQLALVRGAAGKVGVDPQLLGYVAEHELRGMDDNESDRDLFGALAGEDTSIGLTQVKVSTALEIERQDRRDLFPPAVVNDASETERARRLTADDWSLLYAAAYLSLLAERYPHDGALDLAVRYTGANPASTEADQSLYDRIGEALPKE